MKRPLTPLQLAIMESVWQRREATVVDVVADLSAKRGLARNTVHTMMARLESAGWLAHRLDGKTYLYRAVQSREKAVGTLTRRIVDQLFGGSPDGLVMALLDEYSISQDELKRMKTLITQAEHAKKAKK
jgi:predicted transcriptional regulator